MKKIIIILFIFILLLIPLLFSIINNNIFVDPSPLNATTTSNFSVQFNVSISASNLTEVRWNWNGTNYTIYNESLILMFNFDNLTVLGENDTIIKDVKVANNYTTRKNRNRRKNPK